MFLVGEWKKLFNLKKALSSLQPAKWTMVLQKKVNKLIQQINNDIPVTTADLKEKLIARYELVIVSFNTQSSCLPYWTYFTLEAEGDA